MKSMNLRSVLERSSMGPEREGWVDVVPLLTGILRLQEERWAGTAVIRDGTPSVLGMLRFEAGRISAGRLTHGPMRGLAALCRRSDLRLVPADGSELLQVLEPLAAAIDVLQLAAAAMRGTVRQDLLCDLFDPIGTMSIRLAPGADLARYGFDAQEREAIERIEAGPVTVHEFRRLGALAKPALDRLLYVLWLTRAVIVAPVWPVPVSGPLDAGRQSGRAAPARRDDEPTAVVPIAARDDLDTEPAPPAAPAIQSTPSRRPAHSNIRAVSSGRYRVNSGPLQDEQLVDTTYVSKRHSSIPPASESQARLQADAHFEVAERLYERGYVREAVCQAQLAMRVHAAKPDQLALYAWLVYRRDAAVRDAAPFIWEYLERALQLDPSCVRAHYYLGRLFMDAQRVDEAGWYIRRTLELDPAHVGAREALRMLNAR
jgi:hypothetical protein